MTYTATSKKNDVKVEVGTFEQFFKEKAVYPIAIDTYQRPYVWNINKVKELLEDLLEHIESQPNIPYYMGSILLHKNDEKEKLFIIDGQQRMTTLSILYFLLHRRLIEGKIAMEFNSPESIKNIKSIQRFFHHDENKAWKEKVSLLFPNIQFTFITTPSEDLAFTFFDTQNYRGVKLESTDLLKAYHLRAINNTTVQERCAKDWENIQNIKPILHKKGDFTVELFTKYLSRARTWRGQKQITLANDEDMLAEFMRNTKQSDDDKTIELFPNFYNTYGAKLYVKDNGDYEIQVKNHNHLASSLPFSLRQPISKGLGYFLFSKRYAEVIHLLFTDQTITSKEIKRFRDFYENVWKHLSVYLKELFILASLMYYDKFGEQQLFRFSLWLDHLLGAIRLEKQNVVKQAPMNFLKDSENNLLDVISHAFTPEEVFNFLSRCSQPIDIYTKENIEKGKGVRGYYKERILSYYGKKSFDYKESWMDTFVKEIENGDTV
ncbi:DUF262 domain-containing protein [Metabacillus litoralis]|uniref:DUF262 domain-containing protein n=1 Tax=Metabacillus litoralis TaxID=152268 RepID=UPI00203B9546|nr:DUF262 domain-containing protein [Metabacillus litoralis]MCM3163242.1 DUF262 domain-containing protein [Metabacillus litoralis]